MAVFKTRRKHLAKGGLQVGVNGQTVDDMLFGSACLNAPSAAADGRVTGSGAISNVADGDTVVITPVASLPAGLFLYSACGISGGIAASWMNSGSTAISTSADVAVNYFVLS
jgi:hypothetical protein